MRGRKISERPTISALICARDREAYLGEAIESALAQTVPPAEVIVVDDGSEDRSGEIARSYAPRVRVVEQGRIGIGAARNRCVSASRGELIAFLDSDDIWEPRKLELQLEAFARQPELDFCFTHLVEFGEDGVAVRPGPLPGAVTGTMCARRGAIERAGGFDGGVRVGEVMGWLLRAREQGMREAMLPQVLTRRRVHRENMTRTRRGDFGEYARLLKASLDRRRAVG